LYGLLKRGLRRAKRSECLYLMVCPAELVLEALEMALTTRRPAHGVIHHSDQGSQHTSLAFGKRCEHHGVSPSMGSMGDCYDNAMCESFFATLECELIARRRFKAPTEAQLAVFKFIEGWYNPRRRHSSIGYVSPAVYESKYLEENRLYAPNGMCRGLGFAMVFDLS
jgi:putative transposase